MPSRLTLLLPLVAGAALAHPPPGVPSGLSSFSPSARAVGEHRLDELLATVAGAHLDGWVLCGGGAAPDSLAARLTGIDSTSARRWCYLVPPSGEPQLVVAREDAAAFDRLPGHRLGYHSARDLDDKLKLLVRGRKRVAVSLNKLDVATADRLRAGGATLVSSGDVVTETFARWSATEFSSHVHTALRLGGIRDEAWKLVADRLASGGHANEYELQSLVMRSLEAHGLDAVRPVLVAAGPNAGNAEYLPTARASSEIKAGDVLVLRIAARERGVLGSAEAELAWTAFVGDGPPPAPLVSAFAAAVAARDQALALVQERRKKGAPVAGWEVDAAARAALVKAGQGDHGPLPVGHSLSADGPTLDDTDAHDERLLLPRTAYVIAPSVLVPGAFGVRTALDFYLGDERVEITGQPATTLETIKAPAAR